jgi:hypothetical protein
MPGLWDINALRSTGLSFDTADPVFEHAFSLGVHDAGLRVAFLPRRTILHIGSEESAYAINGFARPWDAA